jgi:hypothetical protein
MAQYAQEFPVELLLTLIHGHLVLQPLRVSPDLQQEFIP